MHGWETRMLLRHYLERGVSKTELSRRFGVSRRTIHEWIETGQLDRDLAGGGTRYRSRPAVGHKLDPYKGIIEAAPGGVPSVVGEAALRRGSGGGLHGRVRPCEGLRSVDAAAGARGGGGAVRDAGGTAGAGGLCNVHASLGPAACAGDGPEPLAAVVAALLPAADDGGADRGAGERLRVVRRGAAGVAVRPDAFGGAVGRPRRRGPAGAERGLPALRRPLGVPAAGLPALPSPDQGQGGAADPLPPRQLLLRPAVRQRRGSQRAGARVARRGPPTCAGTAPPGNARWIASNATSGRRCSRCSRWRAVPTGVLVPAGPHSRPGAPCPSPWTSSAARSASTQQAVS